MNGQKEIVCFQTARPVWLEGHETEMNVSAGFRAVIQKPRTEPVVLRIAAHTIYRAWINGEFLAQGPARAAHGFFRVDELDITDRLVKGSNLVAIEVAGYNANGFEHTDQPSFLQAEVTADDAVIASTLGDGSQFEACLLDYRVQKVPRFSFQRLFMEVYRLAPQSFEWRTDVDATFFQPITIAPTLHKQLLPRHVPYAEYEIIHPMTSLFSGRAEFMTGNLNIKRERPIANIGPQLKGYREEEFDSNPAIDGQRYRAVDMLKLGPLYKHETQTELESGMFRIMDFGRCVTGFIGLTVTCAEPCKLWLHFSEQLTDRDVDYARNTCYAVIEYNLEPGTYQLEAIEPHEFMYLKLWSVEGSCTFSDVYLREYAYPSITDAYFDCSDERLNKLYSAAVETFRQNTLDAFMDCPGRERASWLADSFFTARTSFDLSGSLAVEDNLFENYLLPGQVDFMPEGMLPMCYPADHNDGNFIPNWAMLFVVQLEEYVSRGGSRELVDKLKNRVMELFGYFKPFENEDGLLEGLAGWVFVEWSKANDYVQDVNYPTNMLYAAALDAAGRLYGMDELLMLADRKRKTIAAQSFDGEFFVDNALRVDGQLKRTENRTEICQYSAFYFKVVLEEDLPELWRKLCEEFGPDREKSGLYPQIDPANALYGDVFRMELLTADGHVQQVVDESVDYWLFMAEKTGTLWEHNNPGASCNHAFASHMAHVLYRDVLGIYEVDVVNRRIQLRFCNIKIKSCEGQVATPAGPVELKWKASGSKIRYRMSFPDGYQVDIVNLSGKELIDKS